MKVNVNQVLKDLKGEPLLEGEVGKEEKITLKDVCIHVLINVHQKDANLKASEKLKRYKLALLISKGGEVELSIQDIAYIQGLIGERLPVIYVGRTEEMFEGVKEKNGE